MTDFKIAMLLSTRFPPEEGIGNYVYNLSKKLVQRGNTVEVITRGSLKAEFSEYDGLTVAKIPFIMAYPFHVHIHGVFVNSFLRSMADDLDIVHVHTPLSPAIQARVPVVTTFHTPHFPDSFYSEISGFRSFLTKILGMLEFPTEKRLIACSSVVSAVSEGVALDLDKYYGVKSDRTVVLGNAVSDSMLEAGRRSNDNRNDHMILYVGRLDYRKGILDLLEGMKIVVQEMPRANLTIIGKGPMLPTVMRRITELELHRHVQVKGFVSSQSLVEAYLGSAVFVLPSHYEGLPTVALEAMACQVPIVATAVRGNLEIVKSHSSGILVPPRAPKSLARAILYLLKYPEVRRRFGVYGRKLVEEKFTWEKVADRTLALYSSATG